MTIIPRGKGEDQTLLASIIYEAAGGRAGSLTYDGFVRAFRAASQTDLFHRVFGAANLTDERCFVRLYAMLQRKAVFQMKLKGNEREIERFQRIGTALKGMKQPDVPSLISLVREFQGSEWDAELEVVQGPKGLCPCGGCLFVDQEENRRRLLSVIEAHNAMFAQRAACGTAQNSSGFVERIDAKEKDLLYVQADLHGDLATPLALHVWLIKKGAVGGYLPSSLRLVFWGTTWIEAATTSNC